LLYRGERPSHADFDHGAAEVLSIGLAKGSGGRAGTPAAAQGQVQQPAGVPYVDGFISIRLRHEQSMPLLRIALAAFVLSISVTAARATEIVFLCTDALAPSMRELVPQFEKASGDIIKMTVANAGTIAARLQSGESADLAIVLPPAWDRLQQEGRIESTIRVTLGKVGLGAFVRKGSAKPDISTVDAFKRGVLSARRLGVRDPAQRSPVGTYMLALFDRLALSEQLTGKILLTPHPPYDEVIKGEVDLGFSTLAEIAAEPRVELVGPLPPEIQTYNVFVTAVPVGSKERVGTARFVSFLSSDSSKALLRSKGIEM